MQRCEPPLEISNDRGGRDFVRRVLQPLVLTYGVSDMAVIPEFWEPYFDVLSDCSKGALVRAVGEYMRQPDAQFFPKPGPLRALADKHQNFVGLVNEVAAYLPTPKRPEPTEEQKARVRSMLAEFKRQMPEKPPRPKLHENFGAVDSHGLTGSLRKSMADRGWIMESARKCL